MVEVNVTELRSHLPEYLSKANSGETVLVTSRGKVVARILPPGDVKENAAESLRQLRKKCVIGDVISV